MTTTPPAACIGGCTCQQKCAQEECCALDCLVRPRFFGGQLLTDTDLGQLVTWTADKLRLGRYRHGWGVVCGLEVRCDPANPSGVIVGPGYAVSCCGEDIVVCEDTKLDLSGACSQPGDPCADLGTPAPTTARPTVLAAGTTGYTAAEPVIADVTIAYATAQTDPTTPLARSACGQRNGCEFGRVRETSVTSYTVGEAGTDPAKAAAERWLDGYYQCTEVLRQFRDTFNSYRDGKEIRRWLRGWIDKHPLTGFCFLADELATISAQELADESALVKILFYLVQDCRNSYLTCTCFACGAGTGVPLARVWLRPSSNGNGGCSVLEIDGYPPYRRPLRQQCWPALPGTVNGARVIWHRWEDACVALAELGVTLNHREEFTLPPTLAGLADVLRWSPFLKCGERATPQVLSGPLGHRVVGFWNIPNDDLTRISGIGRGRAERLQERGIRSYSDFTAAPDDLLREVFPTTFRDEVLAAMREQAREFGDE